MTEEVRLQSEVTALLVERGDRCIAVSRPPLR